MQLYEQKGREKSFPCLSPYQISHPHIHCMQIIGPDKYKKHVQAEIDRVLRLKTCGKKHPWPDRGEGLEGGPWEARYGDNWRQEIRAKLGRGENAVMCVTKLMEHAIHHDNMLFADTEFKNSWYHACLYVFCML